MADILQQVGRELDAEIAVLIQGWRWISNPSSPDDAFLFPPADAAKYSPDRVSTKPPDGRRMRNNEWHAQLPYYSTDIAAAWEVEEKIKELGLQRKYAEALGIVIAESGHKGLYVEPFELIHATPEQRCLAALKAIGEQS